MRRGFVGPEAARRREVLRETLAAFAAATPADHYHRCAQQNLARWRLQANAAPTALQLDVLAGDWGEVTRTVTTASGECFAVLNMANAHVPGGAYVEGATAQEENMFRRTDCHLRITDDEYDRAIDRYHAAHTRLLSARDGKVLLDTANPRVCLRGAEDRTRPDLGYAWLRDDEVFPFYELRAAAQDLRGGRPFDATEMRRRVAAQLDTLIAHRIRHAVLGAFGCGAFANPGAEVARLYREEIDARREAFTRITFAIYAAGYGPGNYAPFAQALGRG